MQTVKETAARFRGCSLILFFVVLLILALPSASIGQSAAGPPIDFGVWLTYQGNHPFGNDNPWFLVLETTVKRNHGIFAPAAYQLRTGLGYKFNDNFRASAGYTFQYNIPYDRSSQPYKWASQRIFQEIDLQKSFGNGNKLLKQRIRFEERFNARKSPPDFDAVTSYDFETLLRYQLRFEFAVGSKTNSIFYDEVLLRLFPTSQKSLDQNRVFAGLGFALNGKAFSRLEAGYM